MRDIAIDPAFLVGGYTLNVQAAEPAKVEMKSAVQKLEVLRELRLPDIQFDRDDYLPGQTVTGVFQAPGAKAPTATINNVPVPFTMQSRTARLARPDPGTQHGGRRRV